MKRQLNIVLGLIFALCTALVLLAHEDPFARKIVYAYTGWRPVMENAKAYYKIIYDISVGALISLIFYFLVVHVPECQKRRRLRRNLEKRYNAFREGCFTIMLRVTNGTSSVESSEDIVETLMDPVKFSDYFHEKVTPDTERWHELWNNINECDLGELRTHMEIFRDEISFVLNNTDIPKDKPFEFLKELSLAIYSMMHVTLGYDELKPFARQLWWMFTGWSPIEGQANEDPIKKMIDAI